MDSTFQYVGIAVGLVVVVVAVVRSGVLRRAALPPLPESGALPLGELGKYYEFSLPPLAWERVRGWELNQAPAFGSPPPVDHLILTPRLLDFCTSASGRLELVFNFLVGAIQNVTFDPAALPPGAGAPGQGLVTIFTPSGQTRVIATPAFVLTLQNAMTAARNAPDA